MSYFKKVLIFVSIASIFGCEKKAEKCNEIIELELAQLDSTKIEQCVSIRPYTEIFRESEIEFSVPVYSDINFVVTLNIPVPDQANIKLDTNTNTYYINKSLVFRIIEFRRYQKDNIYDMTCNPKREIKPDYFVKGSFRNFQDRDLKNGVRYFFLEKENNIYSVQVYLGKYLLHEKNYKYGVLHGFEEYYYEDTKLIKIRKFYNKGILEEVENYSKEGEITNYHYVPRLILDTNEVSLNKGSDLVFLTKDTTYQKLRLFIGTLGKDLKLIDTVYYKLQHGRRIELTNKYNEPGQHIIQGLIQAIDTVNHRIRQVSFSDTVFVIDW